MPDGAPPVDGETLERLYGKLWLTRRFEEVVAEIYPTDKIKSPVHLSIGQESVAVGVCDALRADDVVSGTYRGHATYLAKGGDAKAMMAELFGKDGGCARGKGGSMHLVDMGAGVLGSSAVVGTTVPVAMGYAFALKREGKGRVVAAFFGDGATEEGVLWESLNFAQLHKLPILFVCENNGYAIHEPIEKRWAVRDLVAKVRAFGLPARRIEHGDVLAIRRRDGCRRRAHANGRGRCQLPRVHDLSLARACRAEPGLRCRLPLPLRARAVAGRRPGCPARGHDRAAGAPQDRGRRRAGRRATPSPSPSAVPSRCRAS